MSDVFVYFAQGESGGPIKIGISRDPVRRVAALSNGSPERLEILFVRPANEEIERRLHRMFAAGRLHGEWFAEDTPKLAEFIELQIRKDRWDMRHRELLAAAA